MEQILACCHHLGYKTLGGAEMRYAVYDHNGWPLAMLGFPAASWKSAPHDNFAGGVKRALPLLTFPSGMTETTLGLIFRHPHECGNLLH